MNKLNEWFKLVTAGFNMLDKIGNLYSKQYNIAEVIFPNRIQPTKGFFVPKVQDYIVPNDWGETDPCKVTIFRNATTDPLSDHFTNLGDDSDVKEFYCPYMSNDMNCTKTICKYKEKLQEYTKLERQIMDLEREQTAIIAKRRAAWQNIFTRNR